MTMNHKLIVILDNPFGVFTFVVISLSLIWQTILRLLSSQHILFIINFVGGLGFIVMMLLLWHTYRNQS